MSKDKNIQGDIPDDVWQGVLKKTRPFLFKLPSWLPISNHNEFFFSQSQLQQHFSDNQKILSVMDVYDKFVKDNEKYLTSKNISDIPDTSFYKEIPFDLMNHVCTACWIRKVVRSGRKKGLSLLLGNKTVENIFMAEKVRAGGRKGHDVFHGNKSEIKERAKEYQDKINELYLQNRNLSYTQLSIKAGKYFEVSQRTIRNHTVSPIKKKK